LGGGAGGVGGGGGPPPPGGGGGGGGGAPPRPPPHGAGRGVVTTGGPGWRRPRAPPRRAGGRAGGGVGCGGWWWGLVRTNGWRTKGSSNSRVGPANCRPMRSSMGHCARHRLGVAMALGRGLGSCERRRVAAHRLPPCATPASTRAQQPCRRCAPIQLQHARQLPCCLHRCT